MRFIPAVSLVRIQLSLPDGPLVKWLRHRPFTAVTRVQFSHGSPDFVLFNLKADWKTGNFGLMSSFEDLF